MKVLGRTIFWAIEYVTRRSRPDQEADELSASRAQQRADARRTRPTKTPVRHRSGSDQSDLGNDPLDFARRRFTLVQEMWDAGKTRTSSGRDYTVLRALSSAVHCDDRRVDQTLQVHRRCDDAARPCRQPARALNPDRFRAATRGR